MSIKRTLIGISVGVLLWGVMATSVHATQGKRGNVGTAYDVNGSICAEPMGCSPISCNSVHRTQIGVGLFQERETCFVLGDVTLPSTEVDVSVDSEACPVTDNPYARCWSSDYTALTGGGSVFATHWDMQIMPGGVINVTSYYTQ